MSFEVKTKKPGDMIRSEDWNEAMEEIGRLERTKLSLEGGGITGPLSISKMEDEKHGRPLQFEREEDKALISIGETQALSIAENGHVGIGTIAPKASLHVFGDLLGAAKDQEGNALRIRCGKTPRGSTNWLQNGSNGIYVDIDTSGCGFKSTPMYLTNLHGDSGNWEATGGSSVYSATPTSFRIYTRFSDGKPLSGAQANSWNWHIQWLAIGS